MYIHSFLLLLLLYTEALYVIYYIEKINIYIYIHTHTHIYIHTHTCMSYAKCLPSSTLAHNKDSVLNRYLIGKHISA